MFTIESVTNLQWTCPDHSRFDCQVKFKEFDEVLPFACVQAEQLPHVQELWSRANSGEFGEIVEYVDPVLTNPDQPQPEVSGAQSL